jgi:hypothetical protein
MIAKQKFFQCRLRIARSVNVLTGMLLHGGARTLLICAMPAVRRRAVSE